MFTGKTILVLDDNKHVLEVFDKSFEKNTRDNKVITYSKFDEKIYKDVSQYDAIVFDYYFDPTISTLEIIKEIRKNNKDVFVLCCSGMFVVEHGDVKCIDTSAMKECLNAGANRVCPKTTQEVIDILDTHFRVRESGQLKQVVN
jgi:CheY-like chemotaxis protein